MSTLFMRAENAGLFHFMAYDICTALTENLRDVTFSPCVGIEASEDDNFVRITYDTSDAYEMHTIEISGSKEPAVTANLIRLYREFEFEQVRPS